MQALFCLQHKVAAKPKQRKRYADTILDKLLRSLLRMIITARSVLQDSTIPAIEDGSKEGSPRGGEASTSGAGSANGAPEQPKGNEHTAKWKLYTNQGRKLVAQVLSHTPHSTPCW